MKSSYDVPDDLSRRSLDWLRRNGKLRPMARLQWNHSSCLSSCILRGQEKCSW